VIAGLEAIVDFESSFRRLLAFVSMLCFPQLTFIFPDQKSRCVAPRAWQSMVNGLRRDGGAIQRHRLTEQGGGALSRVI